jgi:hypothetical protein
LVAWLLFVRALGRQLARTTRLTDPRTAAFAVGATGGLVSHLFELFWTANHGFASYGIVYVLAGLCVAAQRIPSLGMLKEASRTEPRVM